ncbi:MAG: hydrogenase small subunit [Armatimonadota bacterium]
MQVSRRDFLRYCGLSAATIGLSAVELGRLESVLANPSAPSVVWLQGSGCTGCSVSFLNRIATTEPTSAGDLLINHINLAYHPNIMSVPGESAVEVVGDVYQRGNYILAVEGGVPTAYGGATCIAWSYNGQEVTFQQAVRDLSARAAKIVCVGTCAAWGGMAAAPPNPTAVKGVSAVTGRKTINIAGCPPHPDWIFWAVAQLLIGASPSLDSYSRPTAIYGRTVHSQCPRRETEEAETWGVDRRCLEELGCQGPVTRGNCPSVLWNNRANWCCDANALCIRCTEPTFPGTQFTREVDD